MEDMETGSAEGVDREALKESFLQASARNAHTLGEYTADIRQTASTLLQAGGPLAEVAHDLEENASGVERASGGSSAIKIDATLDPHINAFTKIGGNESDITVNANGLSNEKKLAERIMHEKRHNKEVLLKHGSGKVLLITENKKKATKDTHIYEGDTETETAKTFGDRNDKPKDYEEGYEIAKEVQADHAQAWDETLTGHGDLGLLQKEIWEAALAKGKIDIKEVSVQADQTGYDKEAAEVISAYLKLQAA